MTRYKISAYNEVTCERMELFTWTREPAAGVRRAMQDAKNFRMDDILSDYQATPIGENPFTGPKPLHSEIAERTNDAYSYERYGKKEWTLSAKLLIAEGFTREEAEWVLRSKWMRWAADVSDDPNQGTANALGNFIGNPQYNRAAVQREMARD